MRLSVISNWEDVNFSFIARECTSIGARRIAQMYFRRFDDHFPATLASVYKLVLFNFVDKKFFRQLDQTNGTNHSKNLLIIIIKQERKGKFLENLKFLSVFDDEIIGLIIQKNILSIELY